MAKKFLFAIAVVLAVVAFGPGASAANLEPEPSASPGAADVPHGPPPALADRDNNGLSDRLQGKLAGAAPGERFDVVVTFKRPGKGAGPVGTAASAQAAVGSFQTRREFKVIPGFAATMTAAQARALANVAGVFRVEEDFKVKAVLDDTRADMDLDRIQALGPDQIVDGDGFAATGLGVKICVLDTGLHAQHVMFAGRPIVWFDEINGQPNPYDDHVDPFGNPFGHGTHTTGIAAGGQSTHSGGIPISGTAWEADIIAVKVLDKNGFAPQSTIIAGFDRCIESNADVISISLGDPPGDCQDAMALAARAASEPPHNIFIAAAAGNFGPGNGTIITPACEPKVTAVGASTNPGEGLGMAVVAFSSRGPVAGAPPVGSYTKPDVVYPGALIRSAKVDTTNDYWRLSGTSMSAPGVAGLAAMALQVDPTLTPEQIQTILMDTAYDFGVAGVDNDWGAGHVNPYLFMAKVKDPAANPEPSPFQEHSMEQVNVADGGQTFSQSFEVTADDVAAGTPIAMVVTIDGTAFCPAGFPDLYCDLGIIGWDYDPDLDVQLHWDDGTPVTASGSDITLSECVLAGEACGLEKGRGRQETIRYTPLQPGFLNLRLYSFAGSGTARVERWHRLSGAVASPPGNTAPVVDAGPGGTIDEGDTFVSAGSFTDPDADSWTATVDYGDETGIQPLTVDQGNKTFNLSHIYISATGSPYTVTVTVTDDADSGEGTAQVTVNTPASVAVPGVVGMTEAAATTAITDVGLSVGTVTYVNDAAEAGDVIGQNPIAGTLMLSGSAVDLTVSSGPATAQVPNVVSLTQAVAEDQITGAGFVVGIVTTANSDTFAAGTVISQNPAPLAIANLGSAVDIVVSLGPAPGGFGTVSGKVQSATGSNLQGVLVTTDKGETDTTNKQGKYRIDNVPAGSRTLTFSKTGYQDGEMNSVIVNAGSHTRNVNTTLDPDIGPPSDPVTVPNVMGLTEAAAVSAIEGVGLSASVTTVDGTVEDEGRVIDQNPTGSATVDTGSTVNITVSTGPPPAGGEGTVKGSISLSTGGKVKLANVWIDSGPSTTSGNGGKYTLDNVAAGASITVKASKTAGNVTCSGEGVITPVAGGTVNLNIVMSC
jgi:serine protease AprX